jgi:hypothetical protein
VDFEMSDGYLVVCLIGRKTLGRVCHVPLHKLNSEWLSKFEVGDFLFADPNDPSVPLSPNAIFNMVKSWSVYLGEDKVLAMRGFRHLFSRKLFASSPGPYPSLPKPNYAREASRQKPSKS